MITRAEQAAARSRAAQLIRESGFVLGPGELENLEVADFGLGELRLSGAQILPLVDNELFAVKLLAMTPHQTEPEHEHPVVGEYPGKHETIRCIWGTLYLCVPGEPTSSPMASPPAHRRHTYTVWHEHVLEPSGQVSLPPGTKHWFQGGPEGAVIISISSKSTDVHDVFTDEDVRRQTIVQ